MTDKLIKLIITKYINKNKMSKPNIIKIDDVEYVRASEAPKMAEQIEGMDYVVIRSRDSGCHAGYLKKDNETSVVLVNSRRLWYWSGACSLSQLAIEGVKNPSECKFAMVVPEIKIVNHCEIINCTEEAMESINKVQVWKK